MFKFIAPALLSFFIGAAHPGGLGALSGAFKGLSESMDSSAAYDQQKALMLQQHQLEMQRMEREYKLRAEAEERTRQQAIEQYRQRQIQEIQAEAEARAAQQSAQRLDTENREKAAKERETFEREARRLVEVAHPGWVALVNTKSFSEWERRQPASVRALGQSDRVPDAILLLDLYKRDRKTVKSASK